MGIGSCCSCGKKTLGTSILFSDIRNPNDLEIPIDERNKNINQNKTDINNNDNDSDDSSQNQYKYPTQSYIQFINKKFKKNNNKRMIKEEYEEEDESDNRSNLIYREGIIDSQIRFPKY